MLKNNKPVGIHNIQMAVKLFVANNPNYMSFSEAFRNILQAVTYYLNNNKTSTPSDVYIGCWPVQDLNDIENLSGNKLRMLNKKGMTKEQLDIATDIAGTVDKPQGLSDCFGIGVISSSISFGTLLFISRKDGVTNAISVGTDVNGEPYKTSVIDVSEWSQEVAVARGYDRYGSEDFTEVVWMGQNWEQHTMKYPFAPNEPLPSGMVNKNWLHNQIYTRFVDIPANIKIIFEAADYEENRVHTDNKGLSDYTFTTWKDDANKLYGRFGPNGTEDSGKFLRETVKVNQEVSIEYFYDAPTDHDGITILQNHIKCPYRTTFDALTFKHEFFDVHAGKQRSPVWGHVGSHTAICNKMGILDGQNHFRVNVHLSGDKYEMNDMRTDIVLKNSDTREVVTLDSFKYQINQNMPDWFKEKKDFHNSSVIGIDGYQDEVIKLLQQMALNSDAFNFREKLERVILDVNGDLDTESGKGSGGKNKGRGGGGGKPAKASKNSKGKLRPITMPVPTVKFKSGKGLPFCSFDEGAGDNNNDLIVFDRDHEFFTGILNEIKDEEYREQIRQKLERIIAVKVSVYHMCSKGVLNKDSIDTETFLNSMNSHQVFVTLISNRNEIVTELKKIYRNLKVDVQEAA